MPATTALIEGSRSASYEAVDLLLNRPGTDVYKETGDEYTATKSAIDAGDAIMLRRLIRHMSEIAVDEKKPKEVLTRKLVITHLREGLKLADTRRKAISYKQQKQKQRAEAVYDELQAGVAEQNNYIARLLEQISGQVAEKDRENAIIQLESAASHGNKTVISEHIAIEHKKEVVVGLQRKSGELNCGKEK